EDRVQAAKQEAAAALETARGVVDLRRDEEAKRLFETLPDSLEELQEEVEERIGQANRIVCPNPHVLQQFQERQEQIRSMQGKVESERQQLEELRAEVERVQVRMGGVCVTVMCVAVMRVTVIGVQVIVMGVGFV
ncbi:unnamed protein product, partial [Closterium sp. NIES-53]